MSAKKKTKAITPMATTQVKGVDGIEQGMTHSQMLAAMATRSSMSAFTMKNYGGCSDGVEVLDLMAEMKKAGDEVVSGDLSRIEKILVNQALTLDAMFNNLAQRAHKQDTFKGIEVLMRLALKAQAQARSTAEAVAGIKNPAPYIRQANIAQGPQQVNNTFTGAVVPTGIRQNESVQHVSARTES